MKFCNNRGITLALHLLSLLAYGSDAQDMAITGKEPEYPADNGNSYTNKILLSGSDLLNRYETFAQNAVTLNTLVSNGRADSDKYVSVDNGKDFNVVPINDDIMSQPIGTFQYIDPNGDLHIVNFIRDLSGFKILNDYKPYANLQSGINGKQMQSIDTIGDNSGKNDSDNEINYDDYEFTFLPKDLDNTSRVKHSDNNNTNHDVKHSDSDNVMSTDSVHRMNSIPVPPQPPIPVPNPWTDSISEAPVPHHTSYDMSAPQTPPNYGSQSPFPHFYP